MGEERGVIPPGSWKWLPRRHSTPSPARNVEDILGGKDKRSAKPPWHSFFNFN